MTELEKKEYQKKYRQINRQKSIEYSNIYYQNNKEKRKEYDSNNKDKKSINAKTYRENNKEKIILARKIYYKNNKDKVLQANKKWKIESNYNSSEHTINRKKIDPLFKLIINIRNLISISLKTKSINKKSKTSKYLGCSYPEFKIHLERQFKKGMTWDNQGQWHLDHIYPASLAKNEIELIRLNHYTNFQPLWAIDNLSKGNKIIKNIQIILL